MKKIVTIISLMLLVIVLLINRRTPFFRAARGGWSIGYGIYDSIPSKITANRNNIFSIEKLSEINDSTIFLADPFFITKKDTTYMFFEYQMKKNGADIAVMKSVDGETFNYDRVVLDESYHLSYPYVFEHKGDYYMLPETNTSNNVLLYRAHRFPYDWRISDTLIKNVSLYDPSIYLSDTANFLIASDHDQNLFMYTSDSLSGKWQKHKKRSLMMFGSEARPAGRIFTDKNKKIIIPIQNCTKGYGYGVSLYQLNFTEEDSYDIKLANKFFLKANPDINEFAGGMHHVDIQKYNNSYLIVYDGINIREDEKQMFNWKFPIKASFLDTKNYFYALFR